MAEAERTGRSLNDFIADAVRGELCALEGSAPAPEIPVFEGGRGLRAGVHLDGDTALRDVIESTERS